MHDYVQDASARNQDMCGRNSLIIKQGNLEARFDAEVVTDGGYTPRYNTAPGDGSEVITNEAPDEIDRYHWGSSRSGRTNPRRSSSTLASKLPMNIIR